MLKRFFLSALSFGFISRLAAQSTSAGDLLQKSNKLYAVIAILCVIFTGIILFLWNIDRKVSKLEKEIK